MGALNPAQIIRDLGFQHGVDRLAEVMAKQHIFCRDGAIGFQLEHPVSVRLPVIKQRVRRRCDGRLQGATGLNPNGFIAGVHSLEILPFNPARLCRNRL